MGELVFEVTQELDGNFVGESLGENSVTEADSWEQLRRHVLEAVEADYFDGRQARPEFLRLRLRRDQVLAVA